MDDWGSPWADDNHNVKDKQLNAQAIVTETNNAFKDDELHHHPAHHHFNNDSRQNSVRARTHVKKPSIWDSGDLFDEGWGDATVEDSPPIKVVEDTWKVPEAIQTGGEVEIASTAVDAPWADHTLPSVLPGIPHEADAWGRPDDESRVGAAEVLDPWAHTEVVEKEDEKLAMPLAQEKEIELEETKAIPTAIPISNPPIISTNTALHDNGWAEDDFDKDTAVSSPVIASKTTKPKEIENDVIMEKEKEKESEGSIDSKVADAKDPESTEEHPVVNGGEGSETKYDAGQVEDVEIEAHGEPDILEEKKEEKSDEPAPLKLGFVQPEDLEDNPFQEERGVTPTWNNASADADDDDDDFGDFGEFDETIAVVPLTPSRPQTPPKPVEAPVAHVEHELFEPNPKLIEDLYPALTSYPEPPPAPTEIFTTTEHRKAWYRLTREGSLREHMFGADDYVRVSWPKSKVKEDITGIVAKWIIENRTGGSLGNNTSSPRTMFGWGDPASSTKPKHIPAKKSISVGPGTKLTPTPSPIAANFGWGDTAAVDLPSSTRPSVERSRPGSPLKGILTPNNSSPRPSTDFPRPPSVAGMSHPLSRTASLNRSSMSGSPKPMHNAKKSVAFAGVIPSMRPSTSASMSDKAASVTGTLKDSMQSKRMSLPASPSKDMGDWSIFDTKPATSIPAATPSATIPTPLVPTIGTSGGVIDEMDAFESFVSSRPSSRPTSRQTSRPASSLAAAPTSILPPPSVKPIGTSSSGMDDMDAFESFVSSRPSSRPTSRQTVRPDSAASAKPQAAFKPQMEPRKVEKPKAPEPEDDWGDDWGNFEGPESAPTVTAAAPALVPSVLPAAKPAITNAAISISGDDWGFFESKSKAPATVPSKTSQPAPNRSSAPIAISNDEWSIFDAPKATPPSKAARPAAQTISNGQAAQKPTTRASTTGDDWGFLEGRSKDDPDYWGFLEGRPRKNTIQAAPQPAPAPILPTPSQTTGNTITGDDWSIFESPNPAISAPIASKTQPSLSMLSSKPSQPPSLTAYPTLTSAPQAPPKSSQPLQISGDDWGFFDSPKPTSTGANKPIAPPLNTTIRPTVPKRRSSLSKKDNSGTPFHNSSPTVQEDPDDFGTFVTAPATPATKNGSLDFSTGNKLSSNFSDLSSAFSNLKTSNGRPTTLPPILTPSNPIIKNLANPLATPSIPSLTTSLPADPNKDDDDDDWGEMLTSPTTSVAFSSLNPSRAGTPAPPSQSNIIRPTSVPPKSIFSRPVSLPQPMAQSRTGGDTGNGWGDLSFFEEAVKPRNSIQAQPKKPAVKPKTDWDFLI